MGSLNLDTWARGHREGGAGPRPGARVWEPGVARSSAGSTWRRQEQVNGCSPSGSGSRPRAGVPGWERGRAPASPEASAGRLTGPGSGRRPAPALARADLHLRGPE